MSAEGDIDRIVQEAHFPDGSAPGVMVEIGAAHPDDLSISRRFRDRGWRILAVEPNPAFCEEHRKRGYAVLQFACSDHDEDEASFTVVESRDSIYHGVNVTFESFSSLGLRDKFAELHGTVETRTFQIPVVVRRLDRLMAEFAPEVTGIDLLAIDVEGWELDVMRGFDLERFAPRVVILENLFDDPGYRDYMTERGYRLWDTVVPNEVYVRARPQA
ncbi:FkbM family methyltransferase [Brevundimonas subvibrioides]|uniref:Methyltransferase FkbM family n=1 Tax=Brevundimonas subvibrioides (strain ATCC 15264 / DSM 4735 / LMG 14903 / NBRC 16000 / CB 81) TaxID=633149 RepID=D9QG54_BRESC|nr:FkbM family methyltransferase [Brevundimonas subvibrioides]ADL02596.1 methyltransferase FkbM family [Brevundimonas subvibrioides ATCC 15264]